MLVMGVDPGLTRCGLALVVGHPGGALRAVHVEVCRTEPKEELPYRLLYVSRAAEKLMDEHRPEEVAIERVFSQHNVSTAMSTAQAAAVVATAAAARRIPVAFHTPTQVKAAVTSNGAADKAQVTAMVTRLLRLAEPPKPADAADALALAICHIWQAPLARRKEMVRR